MPRSPGTPDQTRRILWLHAVLRDGEPHLEPGLVRASFLHARYQSEYQAERKTLGRDLSLLRRGWKADIAYEPTTRCWRLRGDLHPPADLNPPSATGTRTSTVAAIARLMVESTHGGDLLGMLDQVVPVLQERGGPLEHVTVVSPARMRIADADLLDRWTRFHGAIAQRRRVEFHYRSGSSPKARWFRLDPLRLLWVSGGWYLLAAMPNSSSIFQYALARMEGPVAVLRERFPAPGADRAAHLEEMRSPVDGVYRSGPLSWATLRVEPGLATMLRDRLFGDDDGARWEAEADGSWILRLRYFASREGTKDAARRILSFGPSAMVLAPPSLVSTIAELASSISARYSPKESP